MPKIPLLLLIFLIIHSASSVDENMISVRNRALKAFEKWWTEQSQEHFPQKSHKFEIRMLKDGTHEAGIFATADIEADEELLRVPPNFMLTAARINEATELGQVEDNVDDDVEFEDEDVIAFYVMYVAYCSPQVNPWELWAATLPDSFDSILYFTEEEMELLKGSVYYVRGNKVREISHDTWEKAHRIIKLNKQIFKHCQDLTYDQWKWAQAVVASRKVTLINEKNEQFATVIPMFDYFNHIDSTSDKYTYGYKKFFHTEALKSYKKGEQVFRLYGEYSNGRLLHDYGFILNDNSHDSVAVGPAYFGIDPEDELADFKAERLQNYVTKPLLMLKAGLSQELLEAAKILNADKSDFTEDGKLKKRVAFLTELDTARWFQAVCHHMLQQYPSTLQEDEDLVKSDQFATLSKRSKMAINVRMNEKKILHSILEAFAMNEQRLIRAAQEAKGDKGSHEEL